MKKERRKHPAQYSPTQSSKFPFPFQMLYPTQGHKDERTNKRIKRETLLQENIHFITDINCITTSHNLNFSFNRIYDFHLKQCLTSLTLQLNKCNTVLQVQIIRYQIYKTNYLNRSTGFLLEFFFARRTRQTLLLQLCAHLRVTA